MYLKYFLIVLATEYCRMLEFNAPIPDKALSGHVIRTEEVADEESCRIKCYLEPNCVSINVGPADEGKHTCELNNGTDESKSQSSMKERKHYSHYAAEVRAHKYALVFVCLFVYFSYWAIQERESQKRMRNATSFAF